ncbi:MAG: hypothetical protein JW828_11285 [Sedimentisphaerales bacterium]|nr:hypothetical protein [Sedimentisphaerales bacterium]
MTPVIIVAMVAGAILILIAVWIFLSTKEFSRNGVIVILAGAVLLTISEWRTITLDLAGFKIELQKQIEQAATAADEVAAQVEKTTAQVDVMKTQFITLSSLLQTGQPIQPAKVKEIEKNILALPDFDRAKLQTARETFNILRMKNPKGPGR